MEQTTKDKLAMNAGAAWKMWSNRVMAIAGILFAWYLTLPTVCPPEAPSCASQALILSHIPIPPWLLPIIVSLIGVLARIWPQGSISPAVADAKSSAAPVSHADVPPALKSLTEIDLDLSKSDKTKG